ncbi:hypothetical protein GPJ56_004317 [Histomonas meleagridis]|uniref:uncharacterized protein n=1 Tax=Histomonas meleagridis TaxID=135588 RepID=UPI00355989AA|nr:hypothetical protein GPJ56_004317 [Histomonas meleagridis]KAH0800468.1 hypothetical protein GO595_006671 [Histomonas meleagridis]
MENICNQILQLWSQMRDNSNPILAQSATEQLQQIILNPDSIYPLISITENIKDENVQHFTATFIYVWTKHFYNSINNEKLLEILPKILQFACVSPKPNGREILCDAAIMIWNRVQIPPQPFFELLNAYFQNQNTIGTGFYLASIMIPNFEAIFSSMTDFFNQAISISAKLLETDTTDNIINVYDFYVSLFQSPDLSKRYSEQLSFISNGIHKRFEYLVTVSQDSFEASRFFFMICRAIQFLPEFVHSCLVDLFPATVAVLHNDQLDSMIRISAFTIFESAIENDQSLLSGNIQDYLNHFTQFSLLLCRESYETDEYLAPSHFFEVLSKEADEETVISLFVPIIETLTNSNDPFSYLVCIMIINSIFESIEAEIMDIFEAFEQLVGKSLVSGNKVLIDKSCKLIDKFILTDESLSAQLIDVFEGCLLQNVPISDNAILTLTNLYDKSSKQPKNIEQTLSILYEQFKSSTDPYRIEILCQLIAQIAVATTGIQGKYYEAIQPFLSQLLKMGDSSYEVAVLAYCSFAFSNPLLLRGEIGSLCTIIFNGLSNPDDHHMILTCATQIQNLVDIYTISIAPFIGQFFNRFIELFTNKSELFSQDVEIENEEEEKEYLKVLATYTEMRGQILMTIATIFNFYHDQFIPRADEIKELIRISINDEQINCYAIRSFEGVISGFVKSNLDVTELMQLLVMSISNAESSDELSDIWDVMTTVISLLGKQLLVQYGDAIATQMIIGLKVENPNYRESNKKNILNRRIVTPLMNSVIRFFLEYGRDGVQYIEHILNSLVSIVNGRSKYCKGQAIKAVAFLLTVFPEFKESLYNMIFVGSMSMIKASFTDNRTCAFEALNYLLYVDPNPIFPQLQIIMNSIGEVIQNDSHFPNELIDAAIILWYSSVMIYQIQPQENEFDEMIKFLTTKMNNINVKFTARFIRFASQKWPVKFTGEDMFLYAAGFFASDDYVIRATDQEDAAFLAQFVINVPLEEILQRTGFYESTISLIQKHLLMYRQQ